MLNITFKILPTNLYPAYQKVVSEAMLKQYEALTDSDLSIDSFSFYTSVSAVFSSKIEGEAIELDSYIKHKRFGIEFLPDYTQKIDDLYEAYQYCKINAFNTDDISTIHSKLSKHILPANSQGRVRHNLMFVTTAEGKIEYVAADPKIVETELKKLYDDINTLLNTELNLQEVFFFAPLIHLIFAKIHPFDDGNGRTSRLIEKWFLAEKLGEKAWLISSEKNYYLQHQTYYNNLRAMGLEYELLDYSKVLPFLLMLPQALDI